MAKGKILVGYGVDIDAVAGWLGSYGGEDSTSDISRGRLSVLLTFILILERFLAHIFEFL